MVFVRLLCNISETSFKQFEELNLQSNDTTYSKILYEIVKFGERSGFEKELGIVVQLLMRDPLSRLSAEKLYNMIQTEYL